MYQKIVLGILFALVAGCGGQSADELFAAGEQAAVDPATVNEATSHFKAFVERHPEHQRAPEALKKLAALAQQQGRMQEAIDYYGRILAEYNGSGHGDEAQFMIAFIYEEHIGDFSKAKLAYQRIIDEYPDSELAANARHLLPNVGRNPEDWVEFQDRGVSTQ